MKPFKDMTVIDKLAGLCLALLVVAGMSVGAGTLLHGNAADHAERAMNGGLPSASLVRVSSQISEDVIFHPAEVIDEAHARVYADALKRHEVRELEQLLATREQELVVQEHRLNELTKALGKVARQARIPDALRKEILAEITLQIREAEKQIKHVLLEVKDIHVAAEKVTGNIAPVIPPRAPAVKNHSAKNHSLPAPRNYSCDHQDKNGDAEKRGKKKGREGFLESLSFV